MQPEEIWFGTPNVLMDEGRYTIGWQGWPEKKGGPSYVTVRRSALGALKIVARFPLTDAGWTQAWLALVKLDSATAEAVLRALAHRAESGRGLEERKKLDARSLAFLPEVIFAGGYLTGDGLVAGQTRRVEQAQLDEHGGLVPVDVLVGDLRLSLDSVGIMKPDLCYRQRRASQELLPGE